MNNIEINVKGYDTLIHKREPSFSILKNEDAIMQLWPGNNKLENADYGFYFEIDSFFSDVKDFNFDNYDTSKITNMDYMFNDCSNIRKLNLSKFNTSNVYTMCMMFNNCVFLTNLDLSSFDVHNVKYMTHMFSRCARLKELNLNNFIGERLISHLRNPNQKLLKTN